MAFLTNTETTLLDEEYSIGTNQYIDYDRRTSIFVKVDARPLLVLAESVRLGHRVYEFMTIRRPGDIQHYLRLEIVDVRPDIQQQVNEECHSWNESKPDYKVMPYLTFDSLFYWDSYDSTAESESWLAHRHGNAWQARLQEYYLSVKTLQKRLREVDDFLLQHEISLIDQAIHRLDSLANIERPYQTELDIDESTSLSPELVSLVSELIKRDTVQSVSCHTRDHHFWRMLVAEQVKRAHKTGLPGMQVLGLCGPDGRGELGFRANNWGGEIHIPYEGIAPADLFIKPFWYQFNPEGSENYGALIAAYGPCHYLLTEKDYGEMTCATRSIHGDWVLYESNAPYEPREFSWTLNIS